MARTFNRPIAIARPRTAIGLIGLLSGGSSAISALLAAEHATMTGPICGSGDGPHCIWRLSAVAFALVGLAAFRALSSASWRA